MRKFYQQKLWRDKLIAIRENKGAIVHTIELTQPEFRDELAMKLIEEANELYQAENHQELIKQLADVLEAVDAIIAFHNIDKNELFDLKEKMKKELGSYTTPLFVDYVQYPAGSQEELDCLNNPDRYPEITEDEDCCKAEDDCCS